MPASTNVYSAAMGARQQRIEGLFQLYNERRFFELMEYYSDDISCFLPVLTERDKPEMKLSVGKAEYLANLLAYRDQHGELRVTSVFAVGCNSSVIVEDAHGTQGTFWFEISPEGLVVRVFVHHQLHKRFEEEPARCA